MDRSLLRNWLMRDSPVILWTDDGLSKLEVGYNAVVDEVELHHNGGPLFREHQLDWHPDAVDLKIKVFDHANAKEVISHYRYFFSHEILDRLNVIKANIM